MTAKKTRRGARSIFYFLIIVLLLMIAIGAVSFLVLSKNLPSVEQFDARQVNQSTKIYDREGKVLLYEVSAGQKRTVIPFDQIPQALKDATVAIEDENFYSEPGFSLKGILRALYVDIVNRQFLQGGSTITQQLAKNAFLSSEQTITRKIKEVILATQLNSKYSKDEILNFYLNEIPYGANLYGIEAASGAIFGKSAEDLNVAESALLAAIPRAPSYYSPWGSHVSELLNRQKMILKKLHDGKKITDGEFNDAMRYKLTFEPRGEWLKAPHFSLAVEDYLVNKYGEDMVMNGGLVVKTTLDWNLQQAAEKAVSEGAARNEDLYQGKNAALVAEDPKTGQILAMVGSRDYFDVQNEGNFNVATQGLRQPGSALKPFAYLTAFKEGFIPDSIVFDVPTEFVSGNLSCPPIPDYSVPQPDCFHPQNYDEKFRGPVSFRNALSQSINIPAVKVLYLTGLPNVLNTVKDFGITTLDNPNRYGLSLVLGGGEVRLIEMIKAYSVLAQEGIKHEQSLVLEVRGSKGQILESYKDINEQVVDPQYPRLINGILSDPNLRAPLFGASLDLTVLPGYDVALKTGTSNDYRDAWAIGYTPSLVAGVWAGNNNNAPMQKHGSSILAAVPIWHAFMAEVLKNMPPETFTRPQPVSASKPMMNGDYYFNNQVHSILYYVDRNNPLSEPPANPAADPQFENWETSVADWVKNNPEFFQNYNAPLHASSQTNNSAPPKIEITSPRPGDFIKNNTIELQTHLTSNSPVTEIKIYFNNQTVQDLKGNFPANYYFAWSFSPQNPAMQNNLDVEIINQEGLSGKSSVIVYK